MTTTALHSQATGWTVNDATFAARLALVRLRMGWNVKEAAREVGEPAASWRLWEMEGAIPRRQVEVAKKISTRTGCDYLWLLLGPDGGENTGQYSPQPVENTGGYAPAGAAADREYFQPARSIATVGEPHPHSHRPVTRTRPRSARRPMTPVAV